jgi:hypothetical protein
MFLAKLLVFLAGFSRSGKEDWLYFTLLNYKSVLFYINTKIPGTKKPPADAGGIKRREVIIASGTFYRNPC